MGEGAFVIKEQAHVTISVWQDKVPSSLKRFINNLPPDGKMFAVREPTSVNGGYVHYLSHPDEQTVNAIVQQKKIPAREVLQRLGNGERFELDYGTPLHFLDARRGDIVKYTTVSSNDPAAQPGSKQNGSKEAQDKAKRFSRSKRFENQLKKAKEKKVSR